MHKPSFLPIQRCLKFRHLFGTMVVALFPGFGICQDIFKADQKLLQDLNPAKAVLNRGPSSVVPSEDMRPVPPREISPLENVFVFDQAGILQSIGDQISQWEDREQLAEDWNVQSTGVYETPEQRIQNRYFQRNLLRYFDKRLSREIRTAEQGSAFHTIGQVHQALRPTTKVAISDNIRLRMKARVLQGKGILLVENPYLDGQAEVKINGRVSMDVGKTLPKSQSKANFHYNMTDSFWVASFEQVLFGPVTSKISSERYLKNSPYADDANQRFELLYQLPF